MNRWLLALLIVALALPCRLFDPAPARAADKDAPPGAPQDRQDGEDDPAKRIDKAILDYENRTDQELHQIRKGITQLRTELGQLSELQYDLTVSLAELQAELKAQAASTQIVDNSGNGPASGSSATTTTAQERQRLRAIELARELRQVQDSLRNHVQQKRGETDQLVLQLRNLRAQQRAAAERERNAQASKPSQDD